VLTVREEDANLAPEVSRRVRDILEAVEREADAMREEARRHLDDAKRQADALVAERRRRVSELSDALIARLETLLQGVEGAEEARAAFEGLVEALGEAAERIAQEASEDAEAVPSVQSTRTEPTPVASPAEQPQRAKRDPRADGAHIVAIQMAAAGRTRGEAESYIRDSLEVADPAPVLDEVFGAGTPGDATVPWARTPPASRGER
jgi:hypothetical protein